jgi:hypothetical protein
MSATGMSAAAHGAKLETIVASFQELNFNAESTEETKKPESFSTVQLEWPETGSSRLPVMIPLKKKPLRGTTKPCIYKPFLSFSATETTARGLNDFVRQTSIASPLPFERDAQPEKTDKRQ